MSESLFNENYDPGFLNMPGFGQSATNPLLPVYYDSLGVVKDISVYRDSYVGRTAYAGTSFAVGDSFFSVEGANLSVPTNFMEDVTLEKNLFVAGVTDTDRLKVNGREYRETTVVGKNGTFRVLARV